MTIGPQDSLNDRLLPLKPLQQIFSGFRKSFRGSSFILKMMRGVSMN